MKRTPKKTQPIKREVWGGGRSYREKDSHNNVEPAPMTELTRIVHPITGQSMTGFDFQLEVARAHSEHGQWPAPQVNHIEAEAISAQQPPAEQLAQNVVARTVEYV